MTEVSFTSTEGGCSDLDGSEVPSGYPGWSRCGWDQGYEVPRLLHRWEERWADTRIHGTTKRPVAAMFAEEKPFLLPLPVEPFRYCQYGERVVHLDGCVEVEAADFSDAGGVSANVASTVTA